MDRDEDGVAITIGDADPFPERNENVAIPRHDHAITRRAQLPRQTLGDVERHGFFRDALSGDAAAVESAVAGVDHDDGSVAARRPGRRSEQTEQRQAEGDGSEEGAAPGGP